MLNSLYDPSYQNLWFPGTNMPDPVRIGRFWLKIGGQNYVEKIFLVMGNNFNKG